MILIADIGGTYVRLAQISGGEPIAIEKYRRTDFQDFAGAIERYCTATGIEHARGGAVRIALAGYHGGDVYALYDAQSWLNPQGLKAQGWEIALALNDFEAGAMALPALAPSEAQVIRAGAQSDEALCLIGPGTGLGLAYVREGRRVQKTCGGHMPASAITDEQRTALARVQERLGRPVTFEHVVSGPGLHRLYQACGGERLALEQMLEHLDDQSVKDALGLFHEFMGLFAATVIITGDAYGGLYLTGGVMARLLERGLFDSERFLSSMQYDVVPAAGEPLTKINIQYASYPYPALKGLIHA